LQTSCKGIVRNLPFAMAEIKGRTCIDFKQRESESDYVKILAGDGCSSYVGRLGGSQELSLANACEPVGVIIHELIHAIGFHHEHTREDRDSYIQIKWENVLPGMNN